MIISALMFITRLLIILTTFSRTAHNSPVSFFHLFRFLSGKSTDVFVVFFFRAGKQERSIQDGSPLVVVKAYFTSDNENPFVFYYSFLILFLGKVLATLK